MDIEHRDRRSPIKTDPLLPVEDRHMYHLFTACITRVDGETVMHKLTEQGILLRIYNGMKRKCNGQYDQFFPHRAVVNREWVLVSD